MEKQDDVTEVGPNDREDEVLALQNDLTKVEPNDHEDEVSALEESLAQTISSTERATLLGRFAVALKMRYEHTGEIADLERAIQALQEAIHVVPQHSPIRPSIF